MAKVLCILPIAMTRANMLTESFPTIFPVTVLKYCAGAMKEIFGIDWLTGIPIISPTFFRIASRQYASLAF
jgi:hypothetical protein